jgi:hypothetical protein
LVEPPVRQKIPQKKHELALQNEKLKTVLHGPKFTALDSQKVISASAASPPNSTF